MCSSLRSKSLFNPEKVQGSTIKPLIKSGDFPSLPLMLHRSQPGSIHFWHNFPETLHPPDLNSRVANLVATELKNFDGFVNAQGIGQGLEEMASGASSGWLTDDSWQNSKSQTSSNFWCLDISKLPAHWPQKKLLRFPVSDHHQALRSSSPILLPLNCSFVIVWFMRRASAKSWEKIAVSIAFLIHFLEPKEGFEAIPYLQTIKCNSCSSISNNNLKLRGSTACTKDCIKTLQITSPLYRLVASEYQENWIHAHRDPKGMNFPQQLIFQYTFSLTCP